MPARHGGGVGHRSGEGHTPDPTDTSGRDATRSPDPSTPPSPHHRRVPLVPHSAGAAPSGGSEQRPDRRRARGRHAPAVPRMSRSWVTASRPHPVPQFPHMYVDPACGTHVCLRAMSIDCAARRERVPDLPHFGHGARPLRRRGVLAVREGNRPSTEIARRWNACDASYGSVSDVRSKWERSGTVSPVAPHAVPGRRHNVMAEWERSGTVLRLASPCRKEWATGTPCAVVSNRVVGACAAPGYNATPSGG